MPALVTERWSDRRYQRGERAFRSFDVSGVANENEALVALGIGVNTSHPLDSRLRARMPDINMLGPSGVMYRAGVEYLIPDGGEFEQFPDNPLDEEPVIFPEPASTNEPFDRDADGLPILNSAGDPFESDPTRDVGELLLTITRNESSYDLAKALAFMNKTNDAQFTFPNVGTVEKGQALCKHIRVVEGYKPSASYVRVVYSFGLHEDGFRTRILDQGYNGWYLLAGLKSGKFHDNEGPRSRPVRLDGQGAPFLSGKFWVNGTELPVAYTTDLAARIASGLIEQTPDAFFWRYKKFKSISFNGLDL